MDFINNIAKHVQDASSGNKPPREHDQQRTQTITDNLVNFVDGGASARERKRQEEANRLVEAEIERKRERRDQEGFIGDIKDMWDGGADAELQRLIEERERRRREEEEAGVFGKVQGLMGLRQQEEKPQTVGDKVLGAFGVQQKKPDVVDHGVDLVQEHILGQGSQKDEGMVERFKDDQIAGAIRGALGMGKR
ncbi:hypothetical protein L211DRAFT_871749 [Terfezia boudieri ATCC MYA-4762]|uniref:Uncharacterized protein n=1 Tax=Terfezia boudieri ATCC MYA-4762 TaxID=1051890 RepID=A0A3N4L6N0_9PEZI|nr:hypothetical protein L211DRAFT_871749 [Terfezia boudieri ATCC MYA-4762]